MKKVLTISLLALCTGAAFAAGAAVEPGQIKNVYCAGGACAAEKTSVTLPNGESAVVLQEGGTSTGYVKSIKVVAEPGTVFSGVQIVKKADGSCAKVESALRSMSTVETAHGAIQTPSVESKVTAVSCPA